MPPIIFPSVTAPRLNQYPDQVTAAPAGFSIATLSKVIFATLCSKPVVIKASRHQKIMMSLPDSD